MASSLAWRIWVLTGRFPGERIMGIVVFASLLLQCNARASDNAPGVRLGLVATPLLFSRYNGAFNAVRGGAGVFVTSGGEGLSGSVETSIFGDNARTNALVPVFRMSLLVDMSIVTIDSSTTIGPEAGVQFTLPLNPEGDIRSRTTRIVLGVISHIPFGMGVLDVGFRATPWGSLRGISGDGTSSKYALILRYGLPL